MLAPVATTGCRMRELNTYSPPLRGMVPPSIPQTIGEVMPIRTIEMMMAMMISPPGKSP